MNKPAAHTLHDIGAAVARWLEGGLSENPWYGGPPDEETAEIRHHLVWLNQAGFVTEFSQPASALDDQGDGQRAALSGFCGDDFARRLAAVGLCSDLIVITLPAASLPAAGDYVYQLPISLNRYRPYTWLGAHGFEEMKAVAESLRGAAGNELFHSHYVAIFDPVWGRRDYLWDWVHRCLTTGTAPFDARSAHEIDNQP